MFISKQELKTIKTQIAGLQESSRSALKQTADELHAKLVTSLDELVTKHIAVGLENWAPMMRTEIKARNDIAKVDIVRSLDTLVDEAVKRELAESEKATAERFRIFAENLLAAIREDKAEPVTQRCGYQKLPFAARCELSNGHPGKHFVTKGQNAKPRK